MPNFSNPLGGPFNKLEAEESEAARQARLDALIKVPVTNDGMSAEELMNPLYSGGLTYNDVLILPGYIDFPSDHVDLSCQVTRNFKIKNPFVKKIYFFESNYV